MVCNIPKQVDEVLFATQICSHLKQPSVPACLSHSVVLSGFAGMQMCLVVLGIRWIFYMYSILETPILKKLQ